MCNLTLKILLEISNWGRTEHLILNYHEENCCKFTFFLAQVIWSVYVKWMYEYLTFNMQSSFIAFCGIRLDCMCYLCAFHQDVRVGIRKLMWKVIIVTFAKTPGFLIIPALFTCEGRVLMRIASMLLNIPNIHAYLHTINIHELLR